jgi:hypothetical protein
MQLINKTDKYVAFKVNTLLCPLVLALCCYSVLCIGEQKGNGLKLCPSVGEDDEPEEVLGAAHLRYTAAPELLQCHRCRLL